MSEPIPYISYSAIERHTKRANEAEARLRKSLDGFDRSPRSSVSIRADDLQCLLFELETLKADIIEAQRAALEEAAETIETVAPLTGLLTWQSCVFMIRAGMPESTRPGDQPTRRISRKRTKED